MSGKRSVNRAEFSLIDSVPQSGVGLSACSLHVLVWVFYGSSRVLPPCKNIHIRLTGDKFTLGVGGGVCGYLSLCEPVMNCQLIRGVPHLSLQQLHVNQNRMKWV